jgi:ATP adenylyltransferase
MTERLWAPWRMDFIRAPQSGDAGCVLCAYVGVAPASGTLVLARRRHAFVVLNKYPYTSGHIMVVPTRHTADLTELTPEEHQALWQLTQSCIAPLRATTLCDAINIGVNLGRAAGAGIREHLHVHLVPRWEGDNNFMPVLADVRVVPESLEGTRAHLSSAFEVLSSDAE